MQTRYVQYSSIALHFPILRLLDCNTCIKSGGTCLSTNWNEVEKTDYESERQAPKGMEWKNYEGDKLPMKDDD